MRACQRVALMAAMMADQLVVLTGNLWACLMDANMVVLTAAMSDGLSAGALVSMPAALTADWMDY